MTEAMTVRIRVIPGEPIKIEVNGKDITKHVGTYSIMHQPGAAPIVRLDLLPDTLEATIVGCDVMAGRQIIGQQHSESQEPQLKKDSMTLTKNPTV